MRACVLVLACLAAFEVVSAAWAANPAVLICSPKGPSHGYADLNYLNELHQAGFEVDYTDSLEDVTWERIRQYNVLVLYRSPDVAGWGSPHPTRSARDGEFAQAVIRFAEAGGGVFLFASEDNIDRQVLLPFTEAWGARLPAETIEEKNPDFVGPQTHDSQGTPLAYTDQIVPSPVSEGVKGIWYPCLPKYNAAMGGPIWVDDKWQVVVKASLTSASKPVDMSKSTNAIPNPFVRPEGVVSPPLFAVRSVGAGRVALINQWRQFSIGSGTRFVYNREVLERGIKGKPSDFGRLLQNTFRWLAAPSLANKAVGGFVTKPERLLPPNWREETKREYLDEFPPYDPATLGAVTIPAGLRMYRGLIGAKSASSSGQGTSAEWAAAARKAELDFLVFLEDFGRLTPARFEALKAECKQLSDDKLLLLAGYNLRNNIGNHMFFYGPDVPWPPDLVLTEPDKKTIYIQEEDGKGNWTGFLTPFLLWAVTNFAVKNQVGYYDFQDSPTGMRMPDLRAYGMAAIRYYRGGKLVEEVTDDYLTTNQCTIPPTPAVVNEVASPEDLVREVNSGHALMYGQAQSLDRTAETGLFYTSLRWAHQYDSMPVFVSDGPMINAWAGSQRVWTYGGEDFVTGKCVMPSPLWVQADKGLKEIRIYNGRELFRRLLFKGEKEFTQTLVLDASVQKNLVLVVEDQAGGQAVSCARRNWDDSGGYVSFCGDHVNDGRMYLSHGPYYYQYCTNPALPADMAGFTWDGGPTGVMPSTGPHMTLPTVEAEQGKQEGLRMVQVPALEFGDQGALAVQQQRRVMYDDRVLRIVNSWHTFGPVAGPAPLFTNTQHWRLWMTPSVGVPETYWAAPRVPAGVEPSLFRNIITFVRAAQVKSLLLGYVPPRQTPGFLVISGPDGLRKLDLRRDREPRLPVKHGAWFGFYSEHLGNAQLLFNRGKDLTLNLKGVLELRADPEQMTVNPGDTYALEFASFGFPLDVPVTSAEGLRKYADYLANPTGMRILRGRRADSPGLLEVVPQNEVVELSLPRPAEKLSVTVPLMVTGLNTRWTAGLWQKAGYSKGFYGPGENRYRIVGTDFEGKAYLPLYADWAELTHLVIGHPIVAGAAGKDLFIQVVRVGERPDRWHLSVNNPTDRAVTATLHQAMELPGLHVPDREITLRPGEYRVLQ